MNDLKCFKDYDSLEQYYKDEFEYFKPISNVLKSLETKSHSVVENIDKESLRSEIEKNPIEPFKSNIDMLARLAKGEIYPVYANRTVQPEIEISKYYIYEHTYPRHQVYEIGHEFTLINQFENPKEAVEHWDDLAEKYSKLPDREKEELIMIAAFKDQKPKLDLEGFPVRNSALLLKAAYPKPDIDEGKVIYEFKDWQDMNSLLVKQPALAKFNTQDNKLEFFNSKLAKVNPQDRISYFNLNFFSTKEVSVSHSLRESLKPIDDPHNSHKHNLKNNKGL